MHHVPDSEEYRQQADTGIAFAVKVRKRWDKKGNVWYTNELGETHREDGPALIHPNGDMHWMQHNVLHRDDGPAVVYVNGFRQWNIMGRVIATKGDPTAPKHARKKVRLHS